MSKFKVLLAQVAAVTWTLGGGYWLLDIDVSQTGKRFQSP
jgi:hypothetical protein